MANCCGSNDGVEVVRVGVVAAVKGGMSFVGSMTSAAAVTLLMARELRQPAC